MPKNNLANILVDQLNKRNNPTDLKSTIVGEIVQLHPIIVKISDREILLQEGKNLLLSEWFKLRCHIDYTKKLSETVPQLCEQAKNITEKHSYTSSECNIPEEISYLCAAILHINEELLALKCDLKLNDFAIIESCEDEDKYILVNKML